MRYKLSDFQRPEYEQPSIELLEKWFGKFADALAVSGYVSREDTQNAIDKITRWFAKYDLHRASKISRESAMRYARTPEEERTAIGKPIFAPPDKGLLILGNCGTGKTMMLKILSAKDDRTSISSPFPGITYFTAEWLVSQYQRSGEEFLKDFESHKNAPMIIDELGGERFARFYGNDPVINDMLSHRYNVFKDYGTLTIFVSNLTMEELQEKYGDRISSRLYEMCEFVKCAGEDWRRRTA
jgi:AAA+ superfamily predicted ATPase